MGEMRKKKDWDSEGKEGCAHFQNLYLFNREADITKTSAVLT